MAILINKNTKIITQGITGKAGLYHTEQGLLYGSHFVGGVTPGKGGTAILDLPIFDTVHEAKKRQDVKLVSFLFQPHLQRTLF